MPFLFFIKKTKPKNMKNLLLITLLTISSTLYSQNLFTVSGRSLNGEAPVTFINIYTPAEGEDAWEYYSGNDIFSNNNSEYNIVLPIRNKFYLLEFVNGGAVKKLYLTTITNGYYQMDVNFVNNDACVIYYDESISNYRYDVGTLDELFGDGTETN